ncbi:MAG: metalloregulator ArsR/SmtB family transcription factor [Candidatus Delongbacteria bacterium]
MDETARLRGQAMSGVLKALAHPTRLQMVELLAGGERCVCELAAAADTDVPGMSRHLSQLKSVGILADRRQGKQVFYRLQTPCLLGFLHCIEDVVQAHGTRLVSLDALRAGTPNGGSRELAR